MDTTEIYIKMCDCEEIQGLIGEYDEHNYIHLGKKYGLDKLDDYIWLPRQDQLQEMIAKYDLPNLLVEFYCFVSGRVPKTNEVIADPKWIQYTSMEQLWLAFVMQEKHNKVWAEGWKEGE